MSIMAIQIFAFLSLFIAVLSVARILRGAGQSEREEANRSVLLSMFGGPIRVLGRLLEPRLQGIAPQRSQKIVTALRISALEGKMDSLHITGIQALLALVMGVGFQVFGVLLAMRPDVAIWIGLFLGCLGWLWPMIRLQRMARERQEAIRKDLPYAMDLLSVAMQAGQDFGAAVRFLVNEGPGGALAQEYGLMLRETELGKSRVEALRTLSERIQLEEVKSLVSAIIQSTEMGSSVAETLKYQATEIRRVRFQNAERKAARAPSVMMIPIALFILPAVFIVIFTPIAIQMMHTFKQ